MSALTEHCQLLSRTWTGAMNGTRVVAFLQHLLRRVPGKLLVIWDGALIHRCRAVKQFLAEGAAQRLKLLALPGSAPELNPVEGVWRWLKRVALGNVCCEMLDELRHELRLAFARLRQRKDVLLTTALIAKVYSRTSAYLQQAAVRKSLVLYAALNRSMHP